MSAEPYADPTLPGAAGAPFEAPLTPEAQPAVDILPIAGARKGRPAEEQQHEPPAPADYAPPAEALVAATDIVPPPTWAAPSAPVAEAVPAPVNPWTGQVLPDGGPAAPEAEAPSAKRFLGMQLRRPRRTDDSVDAAALAGSPHQVEAPAEVTVAAWPTDIGAQSVADAEPVHQGWAGPPAFAYAAADVMDAPAQPPVEAPVAEAPPVEAPAVEAPLVEAPLVEAPLVEAPLVEAPLVEAPLVEAPIVEAPIALAPVLGPVPFPVQAASASDEEVRAVRTLLDASDAQRASAEQRADQAVAYGQQLQAELTRVREDLEGRLRAAETRGRAAANEAQDWQIRHREAETQVQELARSIAGSEQRLDDLRAERDELLSALEEATNPATTMARPGQPD